MSIVLEILENNKINEIELVLYEEYIVGRSRKCSIILNDQSASANHCSITLTDEFILIKDLESSNGTFINNSRIDSDVLFIGDILKIGNALISIKKSSLSSFEAAYLEKPRNRDLSKVRVIDVKDGIMQKTASHLNPEITSILKTKKKNETLKIKLEGTQTKKFRNLKRNPKK